MSAIRPAAARRAMAAFARTHVAGRADLHGRGDIPPELWRALGAAGLMGLALPVEYGGRGGGWRALAAGAAALAEDGGNLGLTLSWTLHQLVARLFLLGFGGEAQRARWLPPIARGEATAAIAFSEPGAGAHPKHLSTRAEAVAGGFALSGEKAYLTNGPMADLFIVIAITEVAAGRKRFTAFLVPAGTPGLARTPGVEVDFLKPSPHCGIRLGDCRVPGDAVLGPPGEAYELMSLAMRETEDAVMAGALAGAAGHHLGLLAAAAAKPAPAAAEAALGELAALPEGLMAIAAPAAAELDRRHPARQRLTTLASAFRTGLRRYLDLAEDFRGNWEAGPSPALDLAHRDLAKVLEVAGVAHAAQHRALGRGLLAGAGGEN